MGALSDLIPLIVLFVVVAGAAFIGYQMYVWSNELADRGKKKMEKKNIGFTKDGGLRVGVKELKEDDYADKTQNVLVKAWNEASFPAYKSRLGWNPTAENAKKSSSSNATPLTASKTNSSISSNSQSQAPPELRPSSKRPANPLPGGWE